MSKVFWHVTMLLDAFIPGPNDAMDWVYGYVPLDSPATRATLEEVIRSTGSVLSGRRSYNVGRQPGQRPEARRYSAALGAARYSYSLTKLSGRNRSIDPVPLGRHPQRRRQGARRAQWEGRHGDWRRRRPAVHSGASDRRDSRLPHARLAGRWRPLFQLARRAARRSPANHRRRAFRTSY